MVIMQLSEAPGAPTMKGLNCVKEQPSYCGLFTGSDFGNACSRKGRNHRQNIQAGLCRHQGGTEPITMRIKQVSGPEITALFNSVNLRFPTFLFPVCRPLKFFLREGHNSV